MACSLCTHSKSPHVCELCSREVCKKCVQILKNDRLSFLEKVPEPLTHSVYCYECFSVHVDPSLREYDAWVDQARGVFIFLKNKSEETRLLRRSERPLRVSSPDERETLMRLAFQAARRGFNALVDVQISAVKVRNAGYQTSRWDGFGIPTHVDPAHLPRED